MIILTQEPPAAPPCKGFGFSSQLADRAAPSNISVLPKSVRLKSSCPIAELNAAFENGLPVTWVTSSSDSINDVRDCTDCKLKRSVELLFQGVDVRELIAPIPMGCVEGVGHE